MSASFISYFLSITLFTERIWTSLDCYAVPEVLKAARLDTLHHTVQTDGISVFIKLLNFDSRLSGP